jgi:hypothetical protein
MTRSNRVANRVLLILVGLVAIGSGAFVAVTVFPGAVSIDVPVLPSPTTAGLWATAAAALVIIILCLAWILTRGRGRTSVIVDSPDPLGAVMIDTRVVSDLVSDSLRDDPDVISVGAAAHRMRRRRVLSLRLVVRAGADLPSVVETVERTIDQLDEVLEHRSTVLVRIVATRGILVRPARVA